METAAGGITVDVMKSRIELDQAAINLLLATMATNRASWLQTAKVEHELIAPTSEYTESAADLASSETRKLAVRPAIFMLPKPILTFAELHWILGLYFVAICVLVRFLGPTALRALGSFWKRITGQAKPRPKNEAPVYVSTRERHYPHRKAA